MGQTSFVRGLHYAQHAKKNQMLNSVEGILGRNLAPDAMIYYYHDSRGTTGGDGSISGPISDFETAQAKCRANRDDTVCALPGSTIAVTAASGVTVSMSGINVVGLGIGGNQATITISNSTSYMDVEAGNIEMAGFRFTSTGEATTETSKLLYVKKSNFSIHDCKFVREGGDDGPDILFGASSVQNLNVFRNRFTAKSPVASCSSVAAIKAAGKTLDLNIFDNFFRGSWGEGVVSASVNATDAVFVAMSGNTALCYNSNAPCFYNAGAADSSDVRGYWKNNYIVANVSASGVALGDVVSGSMGYMANFGNHVTSMTDGIYGQYTWNFDYIAQSSGG